jgi:hypothetical protein
VTYDVTREGEDKVIYEFADGTARIDRHSETNTEAASQLVLDFYAQLTGQHDLAYQPAPKEEALARDYLTTYGPKRSAFIVRHAVKVAKAADFPIQTFGGTKNFLPQALAVWETHAEAEKAAREAESRADAQLRREHEAREHKQRLADLRASLPEDTIEALRRHAEEALTAEGMERTRLGYDVLVKIKVDELLEREYLLESMRDDRHALDRVVAAADTR